jgi:hypothetical protein
MDNKEFEPVVVTSLGQCFPDKLIKLIAKLPRAEFDFTNGKEFSESEIYDTYLPSLYFYNKYKVLPQFYSINVIIGALEYFLNKPKSFSVIKSTFTKDDGLNQIILMDKKEHIYFLTADFFDDVAGYTLNVYGRNLDYVALNKEFDDYCIDNCVDDSTFRIGMVKTNQLGFDIGWFDVPRPEVDIELNYGSEFFGKHYKNIINKLNTTFKGVYLFDGDPGTGKTFFIKHLASAVENRPFIYLSDSVISGGLDNPGLIELLAQHKNCVLIIEDAEKYIISRKDDPNSFVANLLNLADGILSDLFGYSIILTHNMDNIDHIDSALKRKGRLQYQYQFGKLCISDAQKKVDSLGLKYKVEDKMSLAEIYNLNTEIGPESVKEEKVMGFHAVK